MTSLWLDTAHRPDAGAYEPGSAWDTVVVGAGITGLVTAVLLARSGQRVLVIEARRAGEVTTGNTTGKVSLLQGSVLSSVVRDHGRRVGAAYVAGSIASLGGIREADAGLASGLNNSSFQIGGAIGLAAASTIATTFTTRYVDAHPGSSPLDAAALTHGFDIAFYALAAVAVLAAVLSAVLIESRPSVPVVETEFNAVPIEEAA